MIAAMPIEMPKQVRKERVRLRLSEDLEVRSVCEVVKPWLFFTFFLFRLVLFAALKDLAWGLAFNWNR